MPKPATLFGRAKNNLVPADSGSLTYILRNTPPLSGGCRRIQLGLSPIREMKGVCSSDIS